MSRLKDYGLTIDKMIEIEEDKLAEIIKGVSFHPTKSKYIKSTSKTLKDEFDSKVPSDLDSLLKLKGVGMKMA